MYPVFFCVRACFRAVFFCVRRMVGFDRRGLLLQPVWAVFWVRGIFLSPGGFFCLPAVFFCSTGVPPETKKPVQGQSRFYLVSLFLVGFGLFSRGIFCILCVVGFHRGGLLLCPVWPVIWIRRSLFFYPGESLICARFFPVSQALRRRPKKKSLVFLLLRLFAPVFFF